MRGAERRRGRGSLLAALRVAVRDWRDGIDADSSSAVAGQNEPSVVAVPADESELRLSVLLDQLPDTILFIVDEDLRYRVATGAGRRGQGVLDWEGKTLFEVSSPENIVILERAYRAALAGNRTVVRVSSTVTHRENEVIAAPYTRGEHPEALVVARDLTEIRGREMALRLVTQQFEQLVLASPTGIALADPQGRISLVNDAFCALFDTDAESLMDTSAVHLLPLPPVEGANSPGSGWVEQLILSPSGLRTDDIELPGPTVMDETRRAVVSAVVLRDGAGEATSVLINAYDTTEQHRYHEHMAYIASHDTLTGLMNRTAFERRLDEHLASCRDGEDCGAVLVVDVDNFRDINEQLGHRAGDDFIVALAGMISRWVRSTDAVARLGADEFAVLLTEGDRAQAEAAVNSLVAQVRDGFRGLEQFEAVGLERRVTASIGAVSVFSHGTTAADLLSDADLAMFHAKQHGRNGYSFLEPSEVLAARASNQINWTAKILAAIENDQLVLHGQPILDLTSNKITALELLVRMIDDDGSLISPAQFISVAEQSGLAVMLDEWVVTHAITCLGRLQQIDPTITVHVNLSGRSVGDLDFADFIATRLLESGVDASGLVLELTETAAVSNIDSAQAFMRTLTALGCVFALDDFGVGYGSFYYLKHLPFGIVKLDGEFVSGSERDPLDLLVMSSLVSIGKGLGMVTIAEFVEDANSLTLLESLGVDGAQGFYIGRPAPLEHYFPQLDVAV
ncbi:putative bifunctional diguanylate cyclase/phosphodiesterase [Subtercola frigoramans]|uniref:Diguanylate cyclase (GGDEF)-like protein n=1 Tax=Subtercola frigoramans TaxID=120298 RepID=A0ABS2L1X8_9MICO|nr:EAL domain-containing protein [Subtercola frigoramans]MBM7471071.1 diguanylate cyclase (GGDEF)-like protein [Subtercola frigoramans]